MSNKMWSEVLEHRKLLYHYQVKKVERSSILSHKPQPRSRPTAKTKDKSAEVVTHLKLDLNQSCCSSTEPSLPTSQSQTKRVQPKPESTGSHGLVSVLETVVFMLVPFLFLVLVPTVGKHVSRTPFQECRKHAGFQVMRMEASGSCNPQGQPAEAPPGPWAPKHRRLLTSIQS